MVSSDEVQRVTDILSPTADATEEDVQALMRLADKNGDGQIDYDEYVHMLMDKDKYLHYNFDFLDDLLNITTNIWTLIDDPSDLDFDGISESKYWNFKRYWVPWTLLFLTMFMCCAYGRIHKRYKAHLKNKK